MTVKKEASDDSNEILCWMPTGPNPEDPSKIDGAMVSVNREDISSCGAVRIRSRLDWLYRRLRDFLETKGYYY